MKLLTKVSSLNGSSGWMEDSCYHLTRVDKLSLFPLFYKAITTSELYKELLDNEKRNFHLINAAVSDLGGVPSMIHHSDMSNTIPDEKVISQVIIIHIMFNHKE